MSCKSATSEWSACGKTAEIDLVKSYCSSLLYASLMARSQATEDFRSELYGGNGGGLSKVSGGATQC